MNRDVVGIFKITTPVVIEKFVRKVKLRQVLAKLSHIQKMICQSCFFRSRHFAARCLRSLHSKKRENEPVTLYHSKNRYVNHVLSDYAILLPSVYDVFTVNNANVKKYLQKKTTSDRLH